ncbi:MAG: LamG-like jellyroll fold domain-containing protein [Planctomycetaceae bacterium]
MAEYAGCQGAGRGLPPFPRWTDAASRGYELLIEEGRLSAALIHFWPGNAIRVQTRDAIPTGTWLHVVLTYDGSSQAKGLRLFLNGQPAECEIVRDQLTKNITGGGGDNIALGERAIVASNRA